MLNRIGKKMLILFFVIVLFEVVGNLFFLIMDSGYIVGRDTIASFGDDRFQIIRMPIDKNQKRRDILYDLKYNKTIESDIYRFYHDKKENVVYIVGVDGYTVLKYSEAKYLQSKAIHNFTKKEQEIYDRLKK